MHELLNSFDFLCLADTHSSREAAIAFEADSRNQHVRSWWSHESPSRGGVGVVITRKFLANFDSISDRDWEEVIPGRLARLKLRGARGNLDIWVVYFNPDCRSKRLQSIGKLSASIDKNAHTLILGDFNFVEAEQERWNKQTANWGSRDEQETKLWQDIIAEKHQVQEWAQPLMTFENHQWASRIDRIYSSRHPATFLDCLCEVQRMPMPHQLVSDHAPIAFSIKRKPSASSNNFFPYWVQNHSCFLPYVMEELSECDVSEEPDPFVKLRTLQGCMRDAAARIKHLHRHRKAEAVEEQIPIITSYLRAFQDQDREQLLKCEQTCPLLTDISLLADCPRTVQNNLATIKDKLGSLYRTSINSRIEELRSLKETLPEYEYKAKKDSIFRALGKLCPGNNASLTAVKETGSNKLLTSTPDIAKALTNHWQKVFSNRHTDPSLRKKWLENLTPFPEANWELSFEEWNKLFQSLCESAPGPDGIPFGAYKKLASLAIPYFQSVFASLLDVDSLWTPPEDFNFAFLYCIPKKADFNIPDVGDVYSCGSTRPISVVNTDNRILANAINVCFSKAAAKWVSPYQRGFVNGRYMLQNVLEIDFHSLRITMNRKKGAIVLFDFAAAFPSMDHQFMWDVLEAVGIDAGVIGAIKKFYINNYHWLRLKNGTFPSVDVGSGVRQGCPLSPILFAVCADVLLRKLADALSTNGKISDNSICAFADDTAVTVENMEEALPKLHQLFNEYEAVSGLALNADKTVLIPLWGKTSIAKEDAYDTLLKVCPAWKDFQVTGAGKYLGFWIGPDRHDISWQSPFKKFRTRTKTWAGQRLGIPCNTMVYKTFCLSVLSFIWQLDALPQRAKEDELWALRRFASGPGNWWQKNDLFLLREVYGMPFDFPSLEILALSAKLRICYTLAPDAEQRLRRLQDVDYFLPPLFAKSWHATNFYKVLMDAQKEAEKKYGISLREEVSCLLCCCPAHSRSRHRWVAKRIQRHLCEKMLKRLAVNHHAEHRLGNRLTRWKLAEPMGILTRRALQILHYLGRKAPPRIAAQYWRMLCNGWCTGRRFQRKDSRCVFGCDAQDSLEHYCRCRVIWDFLTSRPPNGPGVPRELESVDTFFLLRKGLPYRTILALATALHAVFKARHSHNSDHPPFKNPIRILRSFYFAV